MVVNLGVQNFRNLKLRFSVDDHWRQGWLNAIGDDIGCGRLELRDMKYRVDRFHGIREVKHI